jgi:flagellar hook-associated protein 3 FlgL
MTRISTISTLQQSLGLRQIVARQTAESERLAQEVASGMKHDVFASNAPAATRGMEVRSHRSANTAFLDTNMILQGRLDSTASALSGIAELGQGFMDLSLTGAIMTDQRRVYTQQARHTLEQISSLLNSTYGGDYLFSGQTTDTAAVRVVDLPPAPVTVDFLGSTARLSSRIDETTVLNHGVNATDDPFRTILAAVGNALNADVSAMTDDQFNALRTGVTAQLDAGLQQLTALQARLGNHQQVLSERIESQLALENLYSREVVDIEGADVEETAVRLQSMEIQLRATYEVTARMGRMSLLDYL